MKNLIILNLMKTKLETINLIENLNAREELLYVKMNLFNIINCIHSEYAIESSNFTNDSPIETSADVLALCVKILKKMLHNYNTSTRRQQ